MLPEFKCIVANSKTEALYYLFREKEAKVIAGGTDLLVQIQGGTAPKWVVDITRVPELQWNGDITTLSPLLTHGVISSSLSIRANYEALAIACSLVGSPQIRNMGTIGGNIANASPAADSIPPLLIYDAQLTLESQQGQRILPLDQVLIAPYRTSIDKSEIITSIKLTPLCGYRSGYRRLTPRHALALSRLSVAWAIKEMGDAFEEVRIAIGSITPVAFRPIEVENWLKGKKRSDSTIEEAVVEVIKQVREISGPRSTHAFKIPILRDLLRSILKGRPCM